MDHLKITEGIDFSLNDFSAQCSNCKVMFLDAAWYLIVFLFLLLFHIDFMVLYDNLHSLEFK